MGSDALSGKVVAITGASSGIGAATARAFADAGAHVALAARRADRIEAIADELRAQGASAVAIPTDITDEASANAFIAGTQEQLGGLDVLVNNAGLMLLGPVNGGNTEAWRQMLDVNCLGLLYCTHAALPIMREQRSGHIVNVSSVAGRTAAAGVAVYNLTKWGVVGFSEALRQEGLRHGIRVTLVEPGFVETELQSHNDGDERIAAMMAARKEEIGKVLDAEDIADAIVYACAAPPHVSMNELLIRPTGQAR